jgi:hypothetical protein
LGTVKRLEKAALLSDVTRDPSAAVDGESVFWKNQTASWGFGIVIFTHF